MTFTHAPTSRPSVYVLIAAAGSGQRFGAAKPKQFMPLAGKPILCRTIEQFQKCPQIDEIHLVINPKDEDQVREMVAGLNVSAVIHGGASRKESVYLGLSALENNASDDDIVLIHDAARPLVTPRDIAATIQALKTHRAATLCVPVVDTLRRGDGDIVERENLYALQTPQAGRYRDLMSAHESATPDQEYTDDSSLLIAAGIPVHKVIGSRTNIKITTQDDMAFAQQCMTQNQEIRTGLGYDVHAFEDGEHVILCGVKIPHNKKLKGHSDADVGLHTITDAILGAIAQGDIGRHFPPSDDAFKNMDSAVFLEKARDLVMQSGGTIQNIDLTLICEEPKITPHASAMIARVAEILGIDEKRVSIKATTSERLGFTGRGEGIAAQAVATVKMEVS